MLQKLASRLERIEVPVVDTTALRDLERRVTSLDGKLDVSEARLGRLDGVERGIEVLLLQVKELRSQNEKKLQTIQQQLAGGASGRQGGEVIRRDVATLKEIQSLADRRTQDTFEAVYGTIERVVDRLTFVEQRLQERRAAGVLGTESPDHPAAGETHTADVPPTAPESASGSDAGDPAADGTIARLRPERPQPALAANSAKADSAMTVAHGATPELAPDAPLEPGSGRRRKMVLSAIERIAASEAANAGSPELVKSGEPAPLARAQFVAAARRAAAAVTNGQTNPPRAGQGTADEAEPGRRSFIQRLRPRIKSFFIGASMILLVLGALRLAVNFFSGLESAAPTRIGEVAPPVGAPSSRSSTVSQPSTGSAANSGRGAALKAEPMQLAGRTPAVSPSPLAAAPFEQAPKSASPSSPAFLAMVTRPTVPQPLAPVLPAATSTAVPATPTPPAASAEKPTQNVETLQGTGIARELQPPPLPAAFGSKGLIAAAVAGDPGASYEIATRLAEGRNVPVDLPASAAWFDRAARGGLAPALFRLGSMYEKGLGVTKDLQEARRLYLAAADKGHAKAMHNLAVLYAEGLDGKPDFSIASHWFRMAAGYGIVDSQYNLAIMYARGIGIPANLAEAYKWFALAAKGGDKDAARKRDELASKLDARDLEAAKQAVESFVVDRQPDEAITVKAPAGGWDQMAAATAGKNKTAR